jgi:hypothetical protein
MWELRRLAALWASTAWYRNSFTIFFAVLLNCEQTFSFFIYRSGLSVIQINCNRISESLLYIFIHSTVSLYGAVTLSLPLLTVEETQAQIEFNQHGRAQCEQDIYTYNTIIQTSWGEVS